MEKSPLLRLPLELREAIYHSALYYPNGVVVDISGQEAQLTPPPQATQTDERPPSSPQPHATALTATCWQIRHECSTLFYNLNTFHLQPMRWNNSSSSSSNSPSDQRSRSIGPWLKSLGPANRAALRHIDIDIGTWTPPSPRHAQPATTSASTSPNSLRPVPGQVAAYILCLRNCALPSAPKCTFTLSIQYSDVPDLGAFQLREVDLRREEQVYGTSGSVVERALLRQAERTARANREGEVDSFGVVVFMMGLDRCRRAFADFLPAVVERVESEERWGGSVGVKKGGGG